jgi:hypothetical protein
VRARALAAEARASYQARGEIHSRDATDGWLREHGGVDVR